MMKNTMKIGNREFNFDNNEVYVMGILNVTPDSFSDGNKYNNIDAALYRTEEMIKEGASIIDVGGESTRPGHIQISEEEEISRVEETIAEIVKRFDIPVSIDTYKANVAKGAFEAGATMLNDIWGLLYEEDNDISRENMIARYAKEYDVAICLMHNDIQQMESNNMEIVINRLKKSIKIAEKYGIDKDKIMVDPGIGFAKDYENNLYVMNNLEQLKKFDFPILLATSRKSMIGFATGEDVNNRVEGTIATTVLGMTKGIQFVRVHDVKENVRAIKMCKAILNSKA